MQERKRPMPVGIEDFKKLVQGGYYFVDKTRFLRDLLDLILESVKKRTAFSTDSV